MACSHAGQCRAGTAGEDENAFVVDEPRLDPGCTTTVQAQQVCKY